MREVLAILTAHGFKPHGATESVMMPTSATHFVGGKAVSGRLSLGRQRFAIPGTDRRATVGPRTTCIYRVVNRNAVDCQNFRTADVQGIQLFLALSEVAGGAA